MLVRSDVVIVSEPPAKIAVKLMLGASPLEVLDPTPMCWYSWLGGCCRHSERQGAYPSRSKTWAGPLKRGRRSRCFEPIHLIQVLFGLVVLLIRWFLAESAPGLAISNLHPARQLTAIVPILPAISSLVPLPVPPVLSRIHMRLQIAFINIRLLAMRACPASWLRSRRQAFFLRSLLGTRDLLHPSAIETLRGGSEGGRPRGHAQTWRHAWRRPSRRWWLSGG